MDIFISWYMLYVASDYEMMVRITLGTILGFIIGFDRESKNKPAGIKTYMYVCVSSTLITIISIQSVEQFSTLSDRIMMDPMRLTAQIVSGLGFLGAGLILKNGLQIKGLTSAAMIFFSGAVGIGIGAGFYVIVIFSVILSMFIAKIGNMIEHKRKNKFGKTEIHS